MRRARPSGAWAVAVAVLGVARAAGPLPDLGVLGSGVRTDGFAQVLEPREFVFPRDHGPHPAYRQEWWYVTGNLDSATGERFGFELTFFRFALAPLGVGDVDPRRVQRAAEPAAEPPAAALTTVSPPASDLPVSPGDESRWHTRQIYMAHFAITDVARRQFKFAQKLSRGAMGLAGAQAPPLRVWVDDWSLGEAGGVRDTAATVGRTTNAVIAGAAMADGGAGIAGGAADLGVGPAAARTADADAARWTLRAVQDGYELNLDASALLAPVLNGDHGLSRKSNEPGSASYYYSIPRVAAKGRLVRDGQTLEVNGLAWVDREWGSGTLSKTEQGWDWFALQLKDGSTLMFYALRTPGGGRDPNSAGTWVSASGQSRALANEEVQIDVLDHWSNPRGERYPSRWRVRVPVAGIDVEVRPVLPNQELTALTRYWEGAVDVTDAGAGHEVAGRKAVGSGAEGGKGSGRTASTGDAAGRGYVELVGYAAQ